MSITLLLKLLLNELHESNAQLHERTCHITLPPRKSNSLPHFVVFNNVILHKNAIQKAAVRRIKILPKSPCFIASFNHWCTIVQKRCLFNDTNVKARLKFFFEHVIVTGSATRKAKHTLKNKQETIKKIRFSLYP